MKSEEELKVPTVESSLKLELPDMQFTQGSEIRGKVVLRLNKRLKFRSIYFTFAGKEEVFWTIAGIIQRRERVLINAEHAVVDAQRGVLEEGEYRFPFVYMVPRYLPNSFFYKYKKNLAKVEYLLTVQLRGVAHKNSLMDEKLVFLQEQELHKYPLCLKDTEEMSSMWCFNYGKYTLKADLEGTQFLSTEEVKVRMEIDKRKIAKNFKARLEQLVVIGKGVARCHFVRKRVISEQQFKFPELKKPTKRNPIMISYVLDPQYKLSLMDKGSK